MNMSKRMADRVERELGLKILTLETRISEVQSRVKKTAIRTTEETLTDYGHFAIR